MLQYELEVLDEILDDLEFLDEIDALQNFEIYQLCEDDEGEVDITQIIWTVEFEKTELIDDELEVDI